MRPWAWPKPLLTGAGAIVALTFLAPAGCGPPVPSLVPLGGVSEPKPEKKRAARDEPEAPKDRSTDDDDDDDDDDEADDTVVVVSTDSADGGTPGTGAAEAAAAAASAETAPPAKIGGEYVGLDVAVYKVEGMPDRTERDPKARTLLRTPDDDSVEVVILDSGSGKEICMLEGERKGNAVTIRPGQECFEQDSGDAASLAKVKTGTAAVNDETLVVKLDMDFSLRFGSREMKGSLDYQFDGKRK